MIRMQILPVDTCGYKFAVTKQKCDGDGVWYCVGWRRYFRTLAEALEFSKANRNLDGETA